MVDWVLDADPALDSSAARAVLVEQRYSVRWWPDADKSRYQMGQAGYLPTNQACTRHNHNVAKRWYLSEVPVGPAKASAGTEAQWCDGGAVAVPYVPRRTEMQYMLRMGASYGAGIPGPW